MSSNGAKFGNLPARAPESFGVVGLLGDKCKVYYDSIFSARHIGRVSDLLTAQLKGVATDELRFRIILMFSLYEGYRAQLAALARAEGEALPEPLVIECGVDAEKLAIGVSFSYSESETIDPVTLQQKIKDHAVSNRLENFIAQMEADSDQVVVRIQPESHRIEIVSMIGLPGKIDAPAGGERRAVEVYALKSDAQASKLKADYVELGDLDYNRLLKEDGPGAPKDKPATGEILAEGAEEADSSAKIEGEKAKKDRLTRITGVTDHMSSDDEEMRLKKAKGKGSGDASIEADGEVDDDEELSIEEGGENTEAELEAAKKKVGLYQTRITQLQSKIEDLEGKRQTEAVVVKEHGPSAEAEALAAERETLQKRGAKITEMIRNFFSRKKSEEEEMADREQALAKAEAKVAAAETGEESTETLDPETNEILREQVTRLEETIDRMRREAQNLKAEQGNARAQKWAENAVGELLAEKARVHEMARKLNVTLRQKEHEFRSRENVLREELRRKEDQLRQKSMALDRTREQISQMTMIIERNKSHKEGGSDEGQLKQKLNFTQKLLQGSKDENAALAKKVDELRNQLMNAQSAQASKPRTAGDLDAVALKSKYDRLLKENEEFKRANRTLMEKVADPHKPKAGAMSGEEMKKKLEMAMRLAATYQKETETAKLKAEELQREETRLKGEVNRLNNALRAMKASAAAHGKRGGGDDPGGSQAA